MTAARTRARRCWCGRGVAGDVVDAIECAEHDDADAARQAYAAARPAAPIMHVTSSRQVSPPFPRSCDDGSGPSPDRVTTPPDCRTCGGDGFLFHLYDGAVELDGPCPACTRQESAA